MVRRMGIVSLLAALAVVASAASPVPAATETPNHQAYSHSELDAAESYPGGGGRRLLATTAVVCPSTAVTIAGATGSDYDADSSSCRVHCGGGYYRVLNASTVVGDTSVLGGCYKCPEGEFRRDAASFFDPPGFRAAQDTCGACPVGTSNARVGVEACVPCSAQGRDTYQDLVHSTECKICPANTQRSGFSDWLDFEPGVLTSG